MKMYIDQNILADDGYHMFTVQVNTYRDVQRIRHWARDNCKEGWAIHTNTSKTYIKYKSEVKYSVIVGFQSREDLMIFKLANKVPMEQIRMWPTNMQFVKYVL